MKVEWERFKVYEDGSQSNTSYGLVTIGEREYEIYITDHSREDQKIEDLHYRRHVTHAYEVSGIPYYFGGEAFFKVGFDDHPGMSSVGLDRNPGYDDKSSRHCFVGKPKHTMEEVEKLVEAAIVEHYQFDYKAELDKEIERLNKRQALMDEALEYKRNRLEKENGDK